MWSPGKGQGLIPFGQLAYHLWYWDDRMLREFKDIIQYIFKWNDIYSFNINPPRAMGISIIKKLERRVVSDWEKAGETAQVTKHWPKRRVPSLPPSTPTMHTTSVRFFMSANCRAVVGSKQRREKGRQRPLLFT